MITSRRNATVLEYRRVLQGRDPGRLLIEGPKLLREAVAARIQLETVLYAEGGEPLPGEQRLALERDGTIFHSVNEAVLAAVTETPSPQGVVALGKPPQHTPGDLLGAKPVQLVVAAAIQHPGNLGAIARTAEAFGMAGLVALRESARLYRPATLRGSMGSLFRLPALEGLEEEDLLEWLQQHHIPLIVADRGGATPLGEANLSGPLALLLGSESRGVSRRLRDAAAQVVAIPIEAAVDSLGVASAAAILIHAIQRQRNQSQQAP